MNSHAIGSFAGTCQSVEFLVGQQIRGPTSDTLAPGVGHLPRRTLVVVVAVAAIEEPVNLERLEEASVENALRF